MALFDLPLETLRTYAPPVHEPANFDAFWRGTLEEARAFPLDARFEEVDFGLRSLNTFDVTFRGSGGQPVKGWLLRPRNAGGDLPCVVEFIGYGGGRGLPTDWLTYASAGYAHLVMDTRGQGSVWRRGDTPDLAPDGDNPQYPGFLTRGVRSPQTYYYRRVFTDAVRAVAAARAAPGVDATRVAVAGGSQGGGISLAVAGLVPDLAGVLPDVPFLCHFRRASEITNAAPYNEVAGYLRVHRDAVEEVFGTLAYFDGVSFASRIHAPALFSVGLMDEVCPPSTVFAAYNRLPGRKDIRVYPYSGHEAGEGVHVPERLRFLRGLSGWAG
ncbi:acetylxylan esterase (plasmid) [Deinococcus aetherius]|uniref:Acetylxylan esterase n=1 Tax=Deinococcus aetherius TaxID=200252 RepID=A0ABN6RKS3_9DEIO|nr:acetylxylan esterase [Deinococcus aetherius]BDP43937.1 acetylxylan esterase [Deinococcus aetherius]